MLRAVIILKYQLLLVYNTVGPRYLRTFYTRFCIFAIQENIPKLTICGFSLAHLRFIEEIGLKNDVKMTFFWHTELPRYSRFQYTT